MMECRGIHKRQIRKWLFLFSSIIINGFAVSVYVKSEMGVSTISSIPLVLSYVIPSLSLGFTSIIFQAFLILLLNIIVGYRRRYLASMGLGLLFGTVVDLWNMVWKAVPLDAVPNVILYLIAFISLPFGISLALSCNLSALPFDIFTKDLAEKFDKSVKFIKTTFDITCVLAAAGLSLVFLGNIEGVGAGTLVSMLFTGTVVQFFYGRMKQYFHEKF